jgi:methylase of polypeptide subunit release factors
MGLELQEHTSEHRIMTESMDRSYRLIGEPFEHNDGNVFPPFYSSRSDELWSNQYLEELRGKYSRRGIRRLDLLDVGTGSGITAIHWLKLMPGEIESLTMTDNNEYAIDCAKKNIDNFFRDQDKVEWDKQPGSKYEGKTKGGIKIIIEKSKDERVWPEKESQYDYIAFNGPHLDKKGEELLRELEREESADEDRADIRKRFGNGVISGICDPGLRANTSFITELCSHLKPQGYAILTFSDYSISDYSIASQNESSKGQDCIEKLLRLARQNQLVATFLSVSEFCPGKDFACISRLKDIPKRKIMLWNNVVFRRLEIDKPSDPSKPPEKKFNLHKTASGFITAASQIADIYCTKEPITNELYIEMANRMQAFYRMFCEQVGWAKGFEDHFVLSGFTLPQVSAAYSWAYGENIYKHKEQIERQIPLGNSDDSSTSRQTILQDTDIHRLEVWASGKSNPSDGYIDKNIAMNEAVSQLPIGKNLNGGIDDEPHLQVRYRIQLPSIKNSVNISDSAENVIKKLEVKDRFLEDILREVVSKLFVEISLQQDQASDNPRQLTYCLLSRYSGSANTSIVFFLFSSTEDLPFLPLLRSFGRIANTAANNMLKSLIAYEAAKKAARAAVFARNFSHITGSHVISNPQFIHSLAGDDLIRNFHKSLDRSYNNLLAAENNFFEGYLDNPSCAKELWSDATKVLAETRDKVRTGDSMLENTRLFHEYLQGRFDFIARAIDDTKDQPEPVRFVKDLLDGFLLQAAYLDNLVADVGLRLDNMEFWVKIKRNGDDHFKSFKAKLRPPLSGVPFPSVRAQGNDIDWEYCSSTNESIMNKYTTDDVDVLVGLPGGLIAVHAFYSLLENIIRNSAKYGIGNQSQQIQGEKSVYRLTVSLEYTADLKAPDKPYYLIQIYDNYGLALDQLDQERKKQPWVYLQEKLENGFVKDNSEPQTEGLGMLEMQACAQLLCKPDGDIYPGERPEHVSPHSREIANSFNLWTSEPRSEPQTPEVFSLVYNLTLNMPVLVGCLTNRKCPSKSGLLVCDSDHSKLLDRPPFFLIVDGEWLKGNLKLERSILSDRDYLPYRILILDKVGVEPNASAGRKASDYGLRGAVILSDCSLLESISNAESDEATKEIILSVYREWLFNWKPRPNDKPWDLWIGIEREAKQVEEAWGDVNKYLNEDNLLLRLMVQSYSAGERGFATESIEQVYTENYKASDLSPAQQYWNDEREKGREFKKALLFDNHGNCFPEAYEFEKATSLAMSTRFYQKLSGSVSPELFRMLSRPPKEKFMFRFFIYSLLEASLTDVGVVDERLAWSLVEGTGSDHANDRFAEDLLEHQKAGIFPVFRFRHHGAKEEVGHYTLVHKERLEKSMKLGFANQVVQAKKDLLNGEGITFAINGQSGSKIDLITPCGNDGDGGSFELFQIKPDVILIHEGAMDILTAQQVEWVALTDEQKAAHGKQLQALYELAPMIIRTSGRGRKSSWLGEHLPFIEFGQVSSGLLTARNKFSLVRGLLGSVGRKLELD